MDRLAGKLALVIGAASGIGRATSMRFAAEGARVVLADLNLVSVQVVALSTGEAAHALQLDVTSEPEWETAVLAAIVWGGKLDVVCNIAGIELTGTIEDTTLRDWNAMSRSTSPARCSAASMA